MKRAAFFCVFVAVLGSMFCAVCPQAVADSATYTASRDNWLFDLVPNANYGALSFFGTGRTQPPWQPYGVPTNEKAIVGFNIEDNTALFSSLVGGTAQINSITLRLNSNGDTAGATSNTVDVYAITDANADWAEGTYPPPPDTPELGSSCWTVKSYDPDPGVAVFWAGSAGLGTAGVDYNATVLGTVTLPTPTIGQVNIAFSASSGVMTALLEHWAQDTNGGLLLMDPNAAHDAVIRFSSRHVADAGLRPQLIVDYTIIPEPGTLILLACGLVGLLAYAWSKRR